MNKRTLLNYNGYFGTCEICLDSGTLHGKIEFINSLVTFEAETVEQLKQEFELAVDDYLETCSKLGVEPDKTLSGTFNVRIGKHLHKRLALMAMVKEQPINQLVIAAAEQYLEGDKVVHHEHNHTHTIVSQVKKTELQAVVFSNVERISSFRATTYETSTNTH